MMLLGTQRINGKGHLEIGGCDAVELAQRFGTPLYVIDEDLVRYNCREYLRAFRTRYPKTEVAYAGKALLTTAICKIIEQEGLGLDVASGGELYTALCSGFPPERIVFHGNNKSEEELVMALEAGVGRIVVDSFYELEQLKRLTHRTRKIARILIRSTPGIDPHTHRRIKTGQEDSKFGLGVKNGQALQALQRALEIPRVEVLGLHCHIGSQLLHLYSYLEAVKIMVNFMKQVKEATGFEVEEFNLGGGLGIRYLPEHHPPSLDQFAEEVTHTLRARLHRLRLKEPTLSLEPGRSIIGEAGTTLYTIGVVKEVQISKAPGKRVYASIDGGMSDNPRPQLYDAVYSCLLANRAGEQELQPITIAGKHCETDILIWDTPLPYPRPGDILAVQSTGAYNYSMASNYNRLPKPAVVLVSKGQADIIVERETYEDLVRKDVIPPRLQSYSREQEQEIPLSVEEALKA